MYQASYDLQTMIEHSRHLEWSRPCAHAGFAPAPFDKTSSPLRIFTISGVVKICVVVTIPKPPVVQPRQAVEMAATTCGIVGLSGKNDAA